ncbi:hypothetical protein [Metapseudomonas sp. CR1201]
MSNEEFVMEVVKLDASHAVASALSAHGKVYLTPHLRPGVRIIWVDEGFDLILPHALRIGGVPVTYIECSTIKERYSVHWVGEDGFDYHGDFESDLIAALEVRPKVATQ